MRLFWMELYKLLRRKAFLAGLFGALAILLLYFCVGIVGEERSTINGKLYTGWEAVRMDRAVTEEFRGTLSDETAGRIIEKYGFPSQVEEGYGGFRDENYCNGFITEYLGNGWFRDWDDYRISTSLKPIDESELGQTAEKKGEGFFFAYVRGWAVLLDTLQLGMILGSVLLIVGLSPIYAEEHQTRMAALLFTCRDGREKDIAIKTAAAFTLAALVYGMIVSAAFLAVGLVYGFDGAKCMSGMVTAQHAVNPFYAISMEPVFRFVSLVLTLDLLAIFVLCAVILCVSAHAAQSFHAVIMSGILWIAPLLIRMLFGGPGYLLAAGTPLFLIMYGILEDWYNMLFLPVSIALGTGIGCVVNGFCTVRTSEPGKPFPAGKKLPDRIGEVPSPIRSARYRTAHGKTVRCTGHLAAKLLAVRCPEDVRMAVQTGLPIPAAALRAYRTKKRITVRRSSVINEGGPASLRDAGKL